MITGLTQRVSVPTGGAGCGAAGAGSQKPTIDWSGSRIAFQSTQPLSPTTTTVVPTCSSSTLPAGRTERVSEATDGKEGNGRNATEAAISGDGKVVGFSSGARDLEGSEADNNEAEEVHGALASTPRAWRASRRTSGVTRAIARARVLH